MSDYVIETRGLTKTYGEQHSVSNLSIHVRKGRIYGLWAATEPGKPPPCGCCWALLLHPPAM